MKKFLLYLLSLLIIILVGGFLYISLTPPASPLETVNFSQDDKNISITYSRPYKKGRLIFGNESDGALVPYEKYWRTGANNQTIASSHPVLSSPDIRRNLNFFSHSVLGSLVLERPLRTECCLF